MQSYYKQSVHSTQLRVAVQPLTRTDSLLNVLPLQTVKDRMALIWLSADKSVALRLV